jgi:hypothetical protein
MKTELLEGKIGFLGGEKRRRGWEEKSSFTITGFPLRWKNYLILDSFLFIKKKYLYLFIKICTLFLHLIQNIYIIFTLNLFKT